MYLVFLCLCAGLLAGIFTGLVPGIHVNLVSATLLSLAPFLLGFVGVLELAVFIVAMATTHTFLDVLPSIYLGAPESATALGVLPGHRYLLRGNGLMAVKLTIIGSLGSLILSGALFVVLVPLVSAVYPFLGPVMGYVLLLIALFMVLRDNKVFWAAGIFLISGALGFFVLNMTGLENPLFPLLSGLFGVATLLVSLNETTSLPAQQSLPYTDIDVGKSLQALGSGTFSGLLTAVLPGVGAATAAVISMQITRRLGDHGFMVLMGGISTANFVLSLVTLQALGKARNGALVAIKELLVPTPWVLLMLLSVALVAGGVAAVLTLIIGRGFGKVIARVPYAGLLVSIIVLLVIMSVVLSGWRGVVVLIISTAVGLLPALKKTSRTTAMGCLLVPVMIFFL